MPSYALAETQVCLEDSERKDHLMNESVSDKCICRTAPATPGLFKTKRYNSVQMGKPFRNQNPHFLWKNQFELIFHV